MGATTGHVNTGAHYADASGIFQIMIATLPSFFSIYTQTNNRLLVFVCHIQIPT